MFQDQLTSVLKKSEETNGAIGKLTQRIDEIEEKLSEKEKTDDVQETTKDRKRKRSKDSLAIQVHIISTTQFYYSVSQ